MEPIVQKTFAEWASYYQGTGARARVSDPNQWQGCAIDGGAQDRRGFRIATTLTLLPQCDGTEDLTLYFGVENPDITARESRYNFPYGFAEVVEPILLPAHQKAWSKGLIWIASLPNWTNYENAPLEIILLHEIGHLFGNSHIDNTIMADNIKDTVSKMMTSALPNSSRSQVNPLYLSIDKSVYLVFAPEQKYELPLAPPAKSFEQDEQFQQMVIQNSFTSLTGMALQGDAFEATFQKPAGVPRENAMRDVWELSLFASTLVVSADGVDSTLIFEPRSFNSAQVQSGVVFNEGCTKQMHVSGSIAGHLVRPNGVEKQVVLSVNSLGRIQILDDPYNPSAFCDVYSRIGVPCVLLTADYDRIGMQTAP